MDAETIMATVQKKVIENQPIPPGYWVECALRVNQLSEDLDNKLAHFEAMLVEIEAELIKADMPAAKAKVVARSKIDYEEYLKQKAKRKRIDEWIMLAKKRAILE